MTKASIRQRSRQKLRKLESCFVVLSKVEVQSSRGRNRRGCLNAGPTTGSAPSASRRESITEPRCHALDHVPQESGSIIHAMAFACYRLSIPNQIMCYWLYRVLPPSPHSVVQSSICRADQYRLFLLGVVGASPYHPRLHHLFDLLKGLFLLFCF